MAAENRMLQHYEDLHSESSPPRRTVSKRAAGPQSERLPEHKKAQSFAASPTRDPVKSMRLWQKQQLLSAFERAQESEKLMQALHAKQSKKSPEKEVKTEDRMDKQQKKKETSGQKWAMKLARYREDERRRLKTAEKKGDKSLQELEERVKRLREQKQEEIRAKEAANRARMQIVKSHLQKRDKNENQEMVDKLQKYQTRMEKSERCHSQLLKSRSLTAASRRGHTETPQGADDDNASRLMDFLKRQQERDAKLEQYRERQSKAAEDLRKSRETHWLRIAKNKKETQRKTDTRTRELERRHAESVSAVESRHQSVMKETFYRGEQQREREGQNHHNLSRLKRIQSARQAQILHRSVEESRRIDSLKQSRRYHMEKYEEALHSSLIERDRTYELVEVISKSPHSKRVQQVMKELSDSSL